KEHRFVNSNNNSAAASSEKMARGESEKVPAAGRANRDGNATVAAAPPARTVTPPRSVAPPRNSVPPPVPRYSGGGERSSVGGGASGGSWGGSRSSGVAGRLAAVSGNVCRRGVFHQFCLLCAKRIQSGEHGHCRPQAAHGNLFVAASVEKPTRVERQKPVDSFAILHPRGRVIFIMV